RSARGQREDSVKISLGIAVQNRGQLVRGEHVTGRRQIRNHRVKGLHLLLESQQGRKVGVFRSQLQGGAEVLVVAFAPWPAGNPIAVPAVAAVVEVEEFRRQHIRNRGIEYGT